jgi:hypothetical protein
MTVLFSQVFAELWFAAPASVLLILSYIATGQKVEIFSIIIIVFWCVIFSILLQHNTQLITRIETPKRYTFFTKKHFRH